MSEHSSELLPPAVAAEVEQARARGFSLWAQGAIARLRTSTAQELEELAVEVREEVRSKALQVAESHEALFERLVVMQKGELYRLLGYESMRELVLRELGAKVSVHRTTMFQLAGALEERSRLEDRFGSAPLDWTVLAPLGAERRRQDLGRGKVDPARYEALCRKAADGDLSKQEVRAALSLKRETPRPRVGGSAVAPPEEGKGGVGPGQLSAAPAGRGGVGPGQLLDPLDEITKMLASTSRRSPIAPSPEQLPRAIQRLAREGVDFERKLHEIEQTSPEDLEHVPAGDLRESRAVLERLRDRAVRCLERISSAVVYQGYGQPSAGAEVIAPTWPGAADEMETDGLDDPFADVDEQAS